MQSDIYPRWWWENPRWLCELETRSRVCITAVTTVTVETDFKINQENVANGFRGYNNGLREQLTTIPQRISEHAKDSLVACY